jgi:DNA-binding transcriptional regulator LsrR (DeoR family)
MKEMSSKMKEKQEQKQQQQKQIEWRRSKVMELSSQGYSQVEISKTLQISEPTISRDIDYLKQQSQQKIRKYIDETLPNEYEKCLVGITSILREAWTTSQNTEDKKEKIHALSLAKECYSMKHELLTNATVVGDAMKFVSSNNNQKKLVSREEDSSSSSSQESKEQESDYNNKDTELEDEQEEEIGELSQTQTINQVF